jgi:hypothetical protein
MCCDLWPAPFRSVPPARSVLLCGGPRTRRVVRALPKVVRMCVSGRKNSKLNPPRLFLVHECRGRKCFRVFLSRKRGGPRSCGRRRVTWARPMVVRQSRRRQLCHLLIEVLGSKGKDPDDLLECCGIGRPVVSSYSLTSLYVSSVGHSISV